MLQLVERSEDLFLDLDEVKDHLAINVDDDDLLITNLITAATEFIERCTGRSLVETTWTELLPWWNYRIDLARSPLLNTEDAFDSIKYYDLDNAQQTLDASKYILIAPYNLPTRIQFLDDLPKHYIRDDAIQITYTAGGQVPELAKQAVRLLVGTWYQSREGEVIGSQVNSLPSGMERVIEHLRFKGYA